MSRYRATTGELLEQVRMFEGKTKDIYNMAFAGDKADTIAKKLKLDVNTVKQVLGEEIAMEKVERVPTGQYIVTYKDPNGKGMARVFDYRQHAHDFEKEMKKKGMTEEILNEYNPNFGKDTSAGRTKETHAANKKTEGEDKVKSLENEIQRLKLELENEKNATVKPEPNPDTGEVPLTIGIAHKLLKDKQDKKEVKKEELEEVFSRSQIDRLKKEYEPLRNKKINPTNLMKVFDKIDHDKNTLIQLYKSNIPFVSTLAGSRLSQKHNLSPMDIKKIISKEEVQEEVELTEYFATVHSDKKPIADFIKKNKSGIDYVDDDAGGNIEFEGKNAHDLADKVKAKFGVRVTKESFEPIENKSLDENSHTLPSMRVPMTVQYTYIRNPQLFMQILKGTKTGKKMKHVFPRKMGSGEYILRGTGEDHIDFLKTLNSKGVMPKNKILGEELEEDTNKYITEKIKGLENKAKKTGMPYGILKKVYDRGMAAWKGGHRPGAGQQQWAFARVNSFVTKSSGTWGKADKDLAQKVRAAESVEQEGLINFDTRNPEYSAHTQDKGIISFIGQQVDFGPKRFIYVTSYNKNGKIVFGGKGGKKIADYIKSKGFKVTKESIEETRQLKDKEKEMLVSLDGKVIVIDKSDWDKYKAKGYIQAEDIENEACWDTHKQVGTKMKGGKRVPNCVPKNEELEESAASDQAKSMGLTYLKFGRYGKNGKVTHKSDGGALRKFDPKTGKLGDKEKPKFKKMSVADVNVDDIKGNELKIPNVANPSELVRGLKDKYGDKYKVTNGPTSVTITKNQDATSLSSKEKEQEVKKLKDKIGLYKKDGSPSAGKLAGIIKRDLTSGQMPKVPGFIEYDYPSSDTLKMDADEPDELIKQLKKNFGDYLDIKDDGMQIVTAKVKDFDDIKENIDDYPDLKKYGYTDVSPSSKLTPAQKKFQNLLKRLDKDRQAKKAAYLKNEKEEVQEANLTDKQVDMVKKVADKLPKDDFKKRYGKDADNVKFGTATNIVKKKLNIDGYDGARNLVDRLLKKEKGDE